MKIQDFILIYEIYDIYEIDSDEFDYKNIIILYLKNEHGSMSENAIVLKMYEDGNIESFFVKSGNHTYKNNEKLYYNLPISAEYYRNGEYKRKEDYVFEQGNFWLVNERYDECGDIISQQYFSVVDNYKFNNRKKLPSYVYAKNSDLKIEFKSFNNYSHHSTEDGFCEIIIEKGKLKQTIYRRGDHLETLTFNSNEEVDEFIINDYGKMVFVISRIYGYGKPYYCFKNYDEEGENYSDKGASSIIYSIDDEIIEEKYKVKDEELDEFKLEVIKSLQKAKNISVKETLDKIKKEYEIDVVDTLHKAKKYLRDNRKFN